jgi:glycine/D-amino acid oxidase-like deaminating enzyme
MISKADVIVIGSGGLGAATAYYLSKRKGLSVAHRREASAVAVGALGRDQHQAVLRR